MGTAPFFFLLASLLIMVRDGEVRFLLVKLGDSEGVAKEFSRTEGCTYFGHPGDGTTRGTCDEGFLCHDDGSCKPICTVNGDIGDGTSRGTCPQGRLCSSDGTCQIAGHLPIARDVGLQAREPVRPGCEDEDCGCQWTNGKCRITPDEPPPKGCKCNCQFHYFVCSGYAVPCYDDPDSKACSGCAEKICCDDEGFLGDCRGYNVPP